MSAEESVLLDLGPWQPKLVQTAAGYVFHMPVESGFVSRSIAVEVSAEAAAVLAGDVERCQFLWAALHHPHQWGKLSRAEIADYLRQIVTGTRAQAEAFLSTLDARSNRAVSNHVRIMLGYDPARMKAGHWFLDPE